MASKPFFYYKETNMLEILKLMLNKQDDEDIDELLFTLISWCKDDAVTYCNLQEYDEKLDNIVVQMVIERYNMIGAEGTKNQSSSGIRQSYFPFYSGKVTNMLNKHRKVKTV